MGHLVGHFFDQFLGRNVNWKIFCVIFFILFSIFFCQNLLQKKLINCLKLNVNMHSSMKMDLFRNTFDSIFSIIKMLFHRLSWMKLALIVFSHFLKLSKFTVCQTWLRETSATHFLLIEIDFDTPGWVKISKLKF